MLGTFEYFSPFFSDLRRAVPLEWTQHSLSNPCPLLGATILSPEWKPPLFLLYTRVVCSPRALYTVVSTLTDYIRQE